MHNDRCLCLPANLSPLMAVNALIHYGHCRLEPSIQPATRPAWLTWQSRHTTATENTTMLGCYTILPNPAAHVPYGLSCENMTSSTKTKSTYR